MKIGEAIDHLYELRDQKRALNKTIEELNAKIDLITGELMNRLDDEGAIKASGLKATATLKTDIVPNVKNWDEVYQYIVENDAAYILEKRMSAAAFRELLNLGTPIPGTEAFEKRSISLRKA